MLREAISEVEIARKLLLGYPSIKPGDKCEPLLKLIKQLYQKRLEHEKISENFETELSDVYRESLIQAYQRPDTIQSNC